MIKGGLKRGAARLRAEQGFSMAEVLATVAILVILFALVAINVVNWQVSLRQKEMDSKAQTIYVAAQEQMSTIMAAGQESLLQPVGKGGKDGNGVTLFEGVPADSGLNGSDPVEEDSIAYVTSQDLQTQFYADGTAVHALFYNSNLDNSSLDPDLLWHNWVIEYDYKSLTVYAVFYSEDDGTYNCATGYGTDDGNVYNTSYREYKGRLDQTRGHVGYHGGAGSTGSNSYELNPTLTVTNGEELTAQVKCTAPGLSTRDLVFKITIEDEFGHSYTKYYSFGTAYTPTDGFDVDNTVYGRTPSERVSSGAVPIKLGAVHQLDLTLDSLAASGLRFSKLYGSNSNHQNAATGNSNLVEGSNFKITAEVFCPSNQQVKHATCTTSTADNNYPNNSLYGDNDGGTHINYAGEGTVVQDKGQANISCGRHLQNLDQSSNVGSGVTSAYLSSSGVDFGNAKSAEDNDWLIAYGSFDASGSASDSYFNGTDANGLPLFKPISNDSLTTLNGRPLAKADDASVYGSIAGLNIDTAADADTGSGAAGLFASAGAGTLNIANLKLTGSKVSAAGSGSAGVLVGELNGSSVSIDNCQVYLQQQTDFTSGDKDAYKSVWVTGGKAGGLVGSVAGTGSLNINRSSASTVIGDADVVTSNADDVKSSVVAGGLVGEVSSGASVSIATSYADCYLYGKDVAGLVGVAADSSSVTISGDYAAGFMAATNQTAGLVGGKVTDSSAKCYTAMSTLAKNKAANSIKTASGVPDGTFMIANQGNAKAILSYLNNGSSEFTLDQSSQSAPYNLMGQALSSYEWPTVTDLRHYGDWLAGFEEGTLVYYEKYQRGTGGAVSYGFYGANVESTLDSRASDDSSSIHVTGDGYGVVYLASQKPTSKITVTVTNPNGNGVVGTVTIDPDTTTCYPVAGSDGNYVVYPLDQSSIVNTSTVNENGYYLKAQITHEESGTTVDPVYYAFNPHFAKTVKKLASQSDFPVISENPLVEVRTARQLWNLSAYYGSYYKITEDSGMAAGKQIRFSQGRTIDYEEYEWSSFGNSKVSRKGTVVTQGPIGDSSNNGSPFKDSYQGNGFEITNVSFKGSGDYAGLFGCVSETGKVQDVVLTARYKKSGSNKYFVNYDVHNQGKNERALGALAGKNQGSISNCAVSGYYIAGSDGTLHAYENSKVSIGGLVGINDGTIKNCSADTPKLNLSATYATMFAGGFAGRNSGSVKNSYAVGSITVLDAKESGVQIAGFAGENSGTVNGSYCAVALTSSGSASAYGFAPKGGAVKGSYYLYGGTYSFIGTMYPYLSEQASTSGSAMTFANLKKLANGSKADNAHSYNHLNTSGVDAYPFKAVVKDASGDLVHYGDWLEEATLGTLGVFYWEHEVNGSNNGYKMTYIGTEVASDGTATPLSGTTLCTAHNDDGVISEYGYGYYVAKGEDANVARTWTNLDVSDNGNNDNATNATASLELAKQMNQTSASDGAALHQYTFYAYTTRTKSAADGADYICLKDGTSGNVAKDVVQNGSLKLGYSPAGATNTKTYSFAISPLFANSMQIKSASGMTISSGDFTLEMSDGSQTDFTLEPGRSQTVSHGSGTQTAGNAYEVRSVDQLQCINWNGKAGNATTLVSNAATNYKRFNYLLYANNTGTKAVSSIDGIVDSDIKSARYQRYWTQTHDVEPVASASSFVPIAGTVKSSTGSYNAVLYAWFGSTYNGQSYAVKNLGIISDSFNVGLFGTTVGANVSNVIMYGDAENTPVIRRVNTSNNEQGAYSIGGLVGVAYDYDVSNPSTIENCAISGYTIDDSSSNKLGLGEINIGGLIGVSNTNLTKCSAVTDIKLNQEALFANGKEAKYGVFVRVGGLTGATQATVSDSYSGGSCVISQAMQNNSIQYTTNHGSYEIYVGGIAGSGFASNFMNFTGRSDLQEGSPKVKDSYTYFEFPAAAFGNGYRSNTSTKYLKSFAIASVSDRNGFGQKAYIDNCYYYGKNATQKSYFAQTYGATQGSPSSYTYDQMADASAFSAALNNGRTGNNAVWGTVTVTDSNGVAIDGRYSFPSSSVLEGKNFPFPAVVRQNDLTFGTFASPVEVNVHYGDWPISGSHWAAGRDSVDIFADMSDDTWTYKTSRLVIDNDEDRAAITAALNNGTVAGLFTFNDGEGSAFAASSSLVDIQSMTAVAGSSDAYDVTFKVKQDGNVKVRFNNRDLATFTLQITAELQASAALDGSVDDAVYDSSTNTLKLEKEQNQTLKLLLSSKASNGKDAKDLSTPALWSDPVADEEGLLTLTLSPNTTADVSKLKVERNESGAVLVSTTATYDYHSDADQGGKKYTSDLIVNVTAADVMGLSNGTSYNQALVSGSSKTGQDATYTKGTEPSYSLDGDAANMFLYVSGTSNYLSKLAAGDTGYAIASIKINGEDYANGAYDADKDFYVSFGGDVTSDTAGDFNYLPGLLSYNKSAPAGDVKVELTFEDGHVLTTTLAKDMVPPTKLVTITFDSNGSNLVSSTGKTVTKKIVANTNCTLQAPSKVFDLASGATAEALDGSFDYWQLQGSNATYKAQTSYKATGDATFKAVWKHVLTLSCASDSYHSMTASVSADGISEVDGYSQIENYTSVANWAFDGWYDSTNEKSAKKVIDANGNVVSKDVQGTGYQANGGKLVLSADVTLYAKWNRWQPASALEDGKRYVFSENRNAGSRMVAAMANTVLKQSNDNGATLYNTLSEKVTIQNVNSVSTIVSQVSDSAIWLAGEKKVSGVSVTQYNSSRNKISFDGTYYTLQDQEYGYYLTDSGVDSKTAGIEDIDKCESYGTAHDKAARSYFCLEYSSGYWYLLRSYNKINWNSSASVGNHLYLGFGSNAYPSYYENFGNALYPYGEQVTFNPNNLTDHTLALKNGSSSAASLTATVAMSGIASLAGYTAPTATDGWTLDGWYDSTSESAAKVLNADGSFASSSLSFGGGSISGGKLVLTADTTLYAKWAKTITSGYQKVTDIEDGDYLLGVKGSDGTYTMLQYATKSSTISALTSVASTDDCIEDIALQSGSGAVWTLKKNGDYLSIETKTHDNGTEYLDIKSNKSIELTTTNDGYLWSIVDGTFLLNWNDEKRRYRYIVLKSAVWNGSDERSSIWYSPAKVGSYSPSPAKFVFFKKLGEGDSKTIYSWDKH